jgi:hypothetical protein
MSEKAEESAMAKHARTAMLVCLALLLILGAASLRAQDETDAAAAAENEPLTTFTTEEDRTAQVDEILRDESAMLAGEGYFYDPGGRRDPFRSLLAARDRLEFRGPRPEGIPGLLIDEIDITGVFLTSDGPVAQVASADQEKSYLLRVGDQLYDGDVISITASEAVFKQIVDDPTALKPFREVSKKLNP